MARTSFRASSARGEQLPDPRIAIQQVDDAVATRHRGRERGGDAVGHVLSFYVCQEEGRSPPPNGCGLRRMQIRSLGMPTGRAVVETDVSIQLVTVV